jgi:hypothetical protein
MILGFNQRLNYVGGFTKISEKADICALPIEKARKDFGIFGLGTASPTDLSGMLMKTVK